MRRLLVVDDDAISREILTTYASAAGFTVTVAVSGDAALAALARRTRSLPDVIFADVQMAGTTGERLAACLRTRCGAKLIAMSASESGPKGFDGFIRKPFTLEEFRTVAGGEGWEAVSAASPASDFGSAPVLDDAVYRTLKRSLAAADLSTLYALCLDDMLRRIERMRHARNAGLADLYLREAHAIRGSCGFVGASKLCSLAAEMEEAGLQGSSSGAEDADPLDEMLAEREVLQRTVATHYEFGTLIKTGRRNGDTADDATL